MGVKSIIKNAGTLAANSVSKLAALSPEEVEQVEAKRGAYLNQMPDPTDPAAITMTERLLAANSVEIYNAYLSQIKDLYIPIESTAEYDLNFDAEKNIRFINITKWVVDKAEDSLEKLVNVYAVLSNEDVNISLVFHRTTNATNVFLAVTNINNDLSNHQVEKVLKARLVDALKGNFPGAEWRDIDGCGRLNVFKDKTAYSVATASNIPTEKSEKFISQTIEKLLDGTVPNSRREEYIVILMATPIKDVEERKLRLSEMYSGLAPYASWQTNYTYNDSSAFGASATIGVNVGASAGIQNTANQAITDTSGTSDSESDGISESTGTSNSHSDGRSESTSTSKGKSQSVGGDIGGVTKLPVIKIGLNGSLTFTQGSSKTIGKSVSDSVSKNFSKSLSKTVGKAVSSSKSLTEGIAKGTNFGMNFGANFSRASNVTATIGFGEGITQTFTNYNIKHTLDLLEEQMKRYELSTALGMWDFAAYVMSEDHNVANNVARSYLALTQGEESFMSQTAINLWRGDKVIAEDDYESANAKEICAYLRDLRQPIFGLKPEAILTDEFFNVYPSIITATTPLSGKELAYSLNFPRKSISGLPVIECTEFARNISSYDMVEQDNSKLRLGNVFHMNHEEKTPVDLFKESLSSHTFITGSTGSGKSNTVYQILNEVRDKEVKFLVIEPAKGEYKQVFGNDDDVFVYGTNPEISPILRINPFAFPKNIHILEHLDRLVEIFNVAWPMYAAMPAVLKSAVEKSYIDCGWDLLNSRNPLSDVLYPSFIDVANNIKEIIDRSDYDTENKGAYKGSLLTRLESLTNGINGVILTTDDIPDIDLFDRNVIIDLSRVGSSETKSLIMGMLVLKLQEYRMANVTLTNSPLKHVTVLEEAHNLLKRTSTEQASESANLLGKSVEMLANSIAEMRTYGEGFIIADQAPGLLDMSVIRNTNTKIMMRLPDQTDRELVGRSANLNDDQITELARLPKGVAAIYQNEWVQPILCKILKADVIENPFKIIPETNSEFLDIRGDQVSQSLLDWIMNMGLLGNRNREDTEAIKKRVLKSKLSSVVKRDFLKYISSNSTNELRPLIFNFLSAKEAIEKASNQGVLSEWVKSVVEKLQPDIQNYSNMQINLVLALIIEEQTRRDSSYENISKSFTEVYKEKGGVY